MWKKKILIPCLASPVCTLYEAKVQKKLLQNLIIFVVSANNLYDKTRQMKQELEERNTEVRTLRERMKKYQQNEQTMQQKMY